MLVGKILIVVSVLLFVSTLKRPVFLGGPVRRYTSDDSAQAMLRRASRRSLSLWMMLGGVIFASFEA